MTRPLYHDLCLALICVVLVIALFAGWNAL